MKKNLFLSMVLLLGANGLLFGNQIDSLLNSVIHIQRPYVIINLTAGDCINCKSNAFGLFTGICKHKILLISDSKLMKPYLKRNSNIDPSILFIYQKELSELLSYKGLSTVCLVGKQGILKFKLDASVEGKIDSIRKVINANCNSNKNQVFHPGNAVKQPAIVDLETFSAKPKGMNVCKDSLGAVNPAICGFSGNRQGQSFLFNYKFQIGVCHQAQDSFLTYHYLNLDSILALKFRKSIRPHNMKSEKMVARKDAQSLLRQIGQPEVGLIAFNVVNLLLYYNVCYVLPKSTDSQRFVNVRKQFFLLTSRKNSSPKQVFDLQAYTHTYWVTDTIHYHHQLYEMFPHKGYCLKGNLLFIPYIPFDTATKSLYFDKTLKVAEFGLPEEGGDAVFNRFYTINSFPDTLSDFFLKVARDSTPVAIDEGAKKIYFSNAKPALTFRQLCGNKDMDYVYDIVFPEENITRFIGVLNGDSRTVVKGSFDRKTGASLIHMFKQTKLFDMAKFSGNIINTYSRKGNKITFYNCSFQ